jgi:hypothetical protein
LYSWVDTLIELRRDAAKVNSEIFLSNVTVFFFLLSEEQTGASHLTECLLLDTLLDLLFLQSETVDY